MGRNNHNEMALGVIDFARHGLEMIADRYGGDCTLNETRIMIQIIRCQLKGQTCTVTSLHKATGIPMATVSRAVANLQRDGWLSDRADPNDGRKRIISFGPRSIESTPADIERSVQWVLDYRMNSLAQRRRKSG